MVAKRRPSFLRKLYFIKMSFWKEMQQFDLPSMWSKSALRVDRFELAPFYLLISMSIYPYIFIIITVIIIISPPLSLFSAILTVCVCGGGGGGGGNNFCSFWTVGPSEAGSVLRRNTLPFEGSIFRGVGVGGGRYFLLLPGDPVTQR